MFKVSELLKATEGELISGDKDKVIKGVSIDSREIKKGMAFIAIKGDNFDGHDFIRRSVERGAGCIITEREAGRLGNLAVIKVKDTILALGDIARFNRNRYNIPVIAVTGSNGKTTTKDMIAGVLSRDFKVLKNEGTKNNHIGLPLTLLKLDGSYGAAVLEIGTNHFKEVDYLSKIACANIGVIINIGPSHLEYFKNLRGVFKEKFDLIRNLKGPGIAILNADDLYLKRELMKKRKRPFLIGVGIKNKSDYRASDILGSSGNYSFRLNQRLKFALNVPGYYNIYNSLIAIAVARILGVRHSSIAAALSDFKLPKGRLNFLKVKKTLFIDDTYNSNPLSLKQALRLLEEIDAQGRKIAVIGDMLELGTGSKKLHIKAIEDAANVCDYLIVTGRICKVSLNEARLPKNNVIPCGSSLEAKEILLKRIILQPGDTVLVKGSRMMKMEEVFNF
jgi:UDP-N-acetylmuramoyl-tripeptide--D-alanyl-D-alanine ligase